MAIRVFNFQCSEHTTEHFVDSNVNKVDCPICGEEAIRVISMPNFKLDGITGAFPTAYDKWARVHEQASAVANAKYLRHNE